MTWIAWRGTKDHQPSLPIRGCGEALYSAPFPRACCAIAPRDFGICAQRSTPSPLSGGGAIGSGCCFGARTRGASVTRPGSPMSAIARPCKPTPKRCLTRAGRLKRPPLGIAANSRASVFITLVAASAFRPRMDLHRK